LNLKYVTYISTARHDRWPLCKSDINLVKRSSYPWRTRPLNSSSTSSTSCTRLFMNLVPCPSWIERSSYSVDILYISLRKSRTLQKPSLVSASNCKYYCRRPTHSGNIKQRLMFVKNKHAAYTSKAHFYCTNVLVRNKI